MPILRQLAWTALKKAASNPHVQQKAVDAVKVVDKKMDLAAENGGNCELTKKDTILHHNNVIIDGTSNIPATMPVHASELYSKNISALILYATKEGSINIDLEDEIISGSTFTHNGSITHEPTKNIIEEQ